MPKKLYLLITFLVLTITVNAQVENIGTLSGSNYNLTIPGVLTYNNGISITFKASGPSPAGPITVNINSLGAKTIKKQGSVNLGVGDIASGQVVVIVYDGTNFQMISGLGNSGGGTSLFTQGSGLAYLTTTSDNLAIGNYTSGSKLSVENTTNGVGLSVKAYTAQTNTNPLFKLYKSDGSDLMWIHSDAPENVFIGNFAGASNDAPGGATQNTFIGKDAGNANTTGGSNTAIGASNLYFNTTGSGNVALGVQNMFANTTGGQNMVMGGQTLFGNTTGSRNTAIGVFALYGNTTANDNHAIGFQALGSNTTAEGNIAIGLNALTAQSFSNGNTNWASQNIAIGNSALTSNQPSSNTNGINNIGIGVNSLYDNTTGSGNVAIGTEAISSVTTGSNNTAIGNGAGQNNIGGGNVFLGANAGANETGSNKLYIANTSTTSPLIFGDFSLSYVGIGTSSPSHELEVFGTTKATQFLQSTGAGAGKVAVSDASGNLTWTTLTASSINAWEIGGNAPGTAAILGTTDNSNFTIQTGSGALNIGTDAFAKTISIGNSTGTTAVSINNGTGNLSLGTNAITHTIVLGNTTGATAVNINTGTGGTTHTTTNGIYTLNTGTGAISIGTDASAKTISIGGIGANTMNLGNSQTAGSITMGGSMTTGSISMGAAMTTGSLSIGGTAANTGSITIGSSSSANTVNLGIGTGGSTINIGTGGTNAKTINIGTAAVANIINIGSTTGAAALSFNAGTNNVTTTSPTAIFQTSTATDDQIKISPATAGAARFAGTISSNDLTAARTYTFPDASGTVILSNSGWILGGNAPGGASILGTTDNSAVTLQTGTGALNLGTDAAAKTITIGNSTGATAVTINNGTGALSLGTNAFAHTVTIGNVTGATAVNVNTGTGGTAYTTTNGNFTLNTGTGAINLGTDAASKTITIGNNIGTTPLNLTSGTTGTTITCTNGAFTLTSGSGNINLGADAFAKTITLGNVTGGTITNIKSGTGAVNINASTAAATPVNIGTGTTTGGVTIGSATASVTLAGLSVAGLVHNSAAGLLSTGLASLTADVNGVLPLANGGTNAPITAANGAVIYSTATALAATAVGSSGQALLSNGAGAPTWGNPAPVVNAAYFVEQQAQNIAPADAYVNATWITRTLNTTKTLIGTAISRSGNTITLQPGKYEVFAYAPVSATQIGNCTINQMMRLYNVTDATVDILGSRQGFGVNVNSSTIFEANLLGVLDIAVAKTYRIEHYVTSNAATTMGSQYNIAGTAETYTRIYIKKLD